MRISEWSSDVCSSDLFDIDLEQIAQVVLRWRGQAQVALLLDRCRFGIALSHDDAAQIGAVFARRVLPDVAANLFAEVHLAIAIFARKSVVWGKSGAVRLDLVGPRQLIKKKHQK